MESVGEVLYKKGQTSLLPHGGGGGIRTRGSLRNNGFQDRHHRPLGHPSGAGTDIEYYNR